MGKGYNGRILRVDLSERKVWTEEPEDIIYRTYLFYLGNIVFIP